MNTDTETKKTYRLTVTRLISIACIFVGVSMAWFILGGAMTQRTYDTGTRMGKEVAEVWGAPLIQEHPVAWIKSPNAWQDREWIRTASSDIKVDLQYEALSKGLFLHRTYKADFKAEYTIPNPTPIDQTVYVAFPMPSGDTSFVNFSFSYGDEEAQDVVPKGRHDRTRGGHPRRQERSAQDHLPRPRHRPLGLRPQRHRPPAQLQPDHDHQLQGHRLPRRWQLSARPQRDPLGLGTLLELPPTSSSPQSIAMDMPKVLNAGPVAARISFFAPVSLLFFFAVLLIMGVSKGVGLHPMHYFFLGAGCFAFQLLFAYTVDIFSIHLAFSVSAIVSLFLVGGYLKAVGGTRLMRIAVPAQLIYMTLFSYSFFFDGITGLVIAISSVVTLAVLMMATARTNWDEVFSIRKQLKKVIPGNRAPQPPVPQVNPGPNA